MYKNRSRFSGCQPLPPPLADRPLMMPTAGQDQLLQMARGGLQIPNSEACPWIPVDGGSQSKSYRIHLQQQLRKKLRLAGRLSSPCSTRPTIPPARSGSAFSIGTGLQPHMWAPEPSLPGVRVCASPRVLPSQTAVLPGGCRRRGVSSWPCPTAALRLQTHSCRDRLQ